MRGCFSASLWINGIFYMPYLVRSLTGSGYLVFGASKMTPTDQNLSSEMLKKSAAFRPAVNKI